VIFSRFSAIIALLGLGGFPALRSITRTFGFSEVTLIRVFFTPASENRSIPAELAGLQHMQLLLI
jgi:hypothetical protein